MGHSRWIGPRGRDRTRVWWGALVAVAGSIALALSGVPAAAAACSNEAVRVEKSASLPDCRAYEQVSPPQKGTNVGYFSSPFFPEPFVSLASKTQDGSVLFATHEPMPGSASGSLYNLYLSGRNDDGWSDRAISPPLTPVPGSTTVPSYWGTSPDLSKSIVLAENPTLAPGAEPNVLNLYREDATTGSFDLLTTTQTPDEGPDGTRAFPLFAGGNEDFSHVIFGFAARLLPEAPPTFSVYEFADGELRLISVLPNGEPAPEAMTVGGNGDRGVNSVSTDGSHVYFNSGAGLYVRIGGSRTVKVNAPQSTVPDEIGLPAAFWSASDDGNLSFFTSQVPLTDDANTGLDPEGNHIYTGQDLYMYDLAQEKLTDLSVDTNPLDAETGAEVQGVVGASDDGSYVYFVALGALTEGATKGAPNLYLWHDGSTRYLATLATQDSGDWAHFVQEVTSRVSPDGHHVLLSSAAQLTGYDNTDAVTGEPDTEIYRYSSGPSSFECVSCNPDGSRPQTSTHLFTFLYYPDLLPNYMTDDGERIAFATSEGLVSHDTNGQPDIYEFNQGKVALVTTGTAEREARFGEMSPDGKDLYFVTFERLTPPDIDDFSDLYDARSGGGFVETGRAAAPCVGSECARATSARPGPVVSGSSSFAGPPTPKPKRTRCGRNKHLVKRKGKTRCVRKAAPKGNKGGKHRRGAGSGKGGSK